ncbi:hypothetical protein [Sandaracinus amylolyticus]|uniref:hypothetical protein n=1 Tax=Sandaracinus amylolyticus TaxID=927083 RepID=UPI001F1D81CE|nr:hypothetical protein [Sandaracinus amylolyticus]UJR79994.1 Hypothetical protein I5071_20370 [Sandaracinus amylolyticus]
MKAWIAVFVAAALIAAFLGFAGIVEGIGALAGALVAGFVVLTIIALLSPPRPRREA